MIHTPEDMTVTVTADVTLADLQTALAKSRQWLPLDPPNPALSLREILDRNESGPRRYGYGTIRDYVIGLKVQLADGRIVKSGGQVVKNVAGYDLQKLFIGSSGSLGKPQEVTLKLRPLPEVEQFVERRFDTLDEAGKAIEAVVSSELNPVVFDLHRLAQNDFCIILGFDGTKEEVDWQIALAAKLGFQANASLDYDKTFRSSKEVAQKLSVLPSKLVEWLRALGEAPFVARAGNGIIYHRTDLPAAQTNPPTSLFRRVKDAFDPNHALPPLPA